MDPITGAAAKAAAGAAKEVPGLMRRVLGPAADELGAALARYTAFRTRNVGRIVEAADRKKRRRGREDDVVPPRVAHRVLEDGSYCDDELMAEYFGGVLAGSCSPSGRDDRGAAWASLLSQMSSLEVRGHFILYRTWADALRGRDMNLWRGASAVEARLDLDQHEFLVLLIGDSDVPAGSALITAVGGLRRHGLIGDEFAAGPRAELEVEGSPFENLVMVQPTPLGIDLYGWSLGIPDMGPREFQSELSRVQDPDLPMITRFALPELGIYRTEPETNTETSDSG